MPLKARVQQSPAPGKPANTYKAPIAVATTDNRITITSDPSSVEKKEAPHPAQGYLLQFTEFLKYIHDKKDFDLYYYLMNELEIEQFNKDRVIMTSEKTSTAIKNQINTMLEEFFNAKPEFILNQGLNINSFKVLLSEKLQKSNNWSMVKEKFSKAEIQDIILRGKANDGSS